MFDIFQNTDRPNSDLFFSKNDPQDVRLGEIVSFNPTDYETAEIVILGCPQDEGVARNKGRIGAALAPEAIRLQLYKLSIFDINCKIFDLGNTIIQKNLEKTHDLHTNIVEQVLKDGKSLIVLGGGNDLSYADGAAVAKVFGSENWQAVNIDAHFDVRLDDPRNSGTPYRQLLDERKVLPENFFEIGFQKQVNSTVYFNYLQRLGVKIVSLEEIQSRQFNFRDFFRKQEIKSLQTNCFWGFDVDAVRAADAPGVSASSPLGLAAKDFINFAGFAGTLKQTKIIEFTEVNPNFDIDHRTSKLVAFAIHDFLQNKKG